MLDTILEKFDKFARMLVSPANLPDRGKIKWCKREPGWLTDTFPKSSVALPPVVSLDDPTRNEAFISKLAQQSEAEGASPLWEGYRKVCAKDPTVPFSDAAFERLPSQVSPSLRQGRFFHLLASERKSKLIVDFGTAFGFSSIYWASGLSGNGRVLTFEPNELWHHRAKQNILAFTNRVTPILGTFEDNIDKHLQNGEQPDIALIDAIHTSEFVDRQFQLLLPRVRKHGLILFDDINFSDDMRRCWGRWSNYQAVIASMEVEDRLGVVEIR